MRPDAVFLPKSVKSGGKLRDRITTVADVAELILECNRSAGERAYIRKQQHGRLFVTRDAHDTILFPTGHPRSGSPRYRWERQDGGVEVGWLLEAGG
jgi:hypothetical protein